MKNNYIVFIQIHSQSEKLLPCIEALIHQIQLPDKIVIVDDGTPDSSVYDAYNEILNNIDINNISFEYCKASKNKEPNLDTVGLSIRYAYLSNILFDTEHHYDYLCIIDVDTLLAANYFSRIIPLMTYPEPNCSDLVCASGSIVAKGEIEKINIGAYIGRKDARGSGKIIKTSFLKTIRSDAFPEIAWDTWINTKAKIDGYLAKEIFDVYMYCPPTTRVSGKDQFRSGRLSYHFGYNPLLVLLKAILAKKNILLFLRGYFDARKKKWRLNDNEVRKYFGWRFLFHWWK